MASMIGQHNSQSSPLIITLLMIISIRTYIILTWFFNQITAPINLLEPVVSDATILASVIVEQPIIQAVISSVKMFDGTKSKFESWITSGENAAQILKQYILHKAFSMIIESPLTSSHSLKDHLLH